MEFKRVTLEEQHYIYVDRECPYGPEIADAMGSAFGKVFGFVGQNGIQPLAMPMSVYLGMDPEILRFRGGVIVSAEDAAKASGNIKTDVLPAGDAMTTTHVGSYNNMNQTHGAMWKHMEAEGIPGAMPVWEIYVDDPGEVAEENVRTEIFRAIG